MVGGGKGKALSHTATQYVLRSCVRHRRPRRAATVETTTQQPRHKVTALSAFRLGAAAAVLAQPSGSRLKEARCLIPRRISDSQSGGLVQGAADPSHTKPPAAPAAPGPRLPPPCHRLRRRPDRPRRHRRAIADSRAQ